MQNSKLTSEHTLTIKIPSTHEKDASAKEDFQNNSFFYAMKFPQNSSNITVCKHGHMF